MYVIKCDLCKKEIDGESIIAGIGLFPRIELCRKCGNPILNFLKKYKFVNKKKKKLE